MGLQSIVARGDLLRKINFPKYIIVISATVSALISLSINLCVIIIFALIAHVDFTWLALLAPLSILQLYLIAVGLALILSTLYVKYRDLSHIWEVLMQVIFYAMPIMYPLSKVLDDNPFIGKIMLMNPIAQSIQDARHNLIAPETTFTTWNIIDKFWLGIVPVLLSVAILVLGIVIFRKNSKKFAENL